MNEGFFTSSNLTRKRPLPPVLKIKLPEEVKKPKEEFKPSVPFDEQLAMDIECYVNYFLVKFMRVSDDKLWVFEKTKWNDLDRKGIRKLLDNYEIITKNGEGFDVPILKYALKCNPSCQDLKIAANELIKGNLAVYKFEEKHKLPETDFDHIDLEEVAPGVQISLKIYGGRMHTKKMQDLPYPEDATLTEKEMDDVEEYCGNDLVMTKELFLKLLPAIEIRRKMSLKYGIDLMSKSDAQVAEAVIKLEVSKKTGKKIKKASSSEAEEPFYYDIPDFIRFDNPKLNDILDILYNGKFKIVNHSVVAPSDLANLEKFKVGHSVYQMGIGGLHSTEKTVFHFSNDEYDLWDWDVSSYYPKLILNQGLYPPALGPVFLDIYGDYYYTRIDAKATKDPTLTDLIDMLKIFLNGTYGKTGSHFSAFYYPKMMIQVTLTGQLSLLMLVDILERRGFPVVSGNTDGITVKCPKGQEATMKSIIARWSATTGLDMEASQYAAVYSRDINNYLAFKYDGSVKRKGCFAPPSLKISPENEICTLALIEYFKHGTPVEETIKACKDITKFVTVRQANGGAEKDGKYIGKAIRWYYPTGERGAIHYRTTGNKVADTDGARPIMDISGPFPDDIDYQRYINITRGMFQ